MGLVTGIALVFKDRLYTNDAYIDVHNQIFEALGELNTINDIHIMKDRFSPA
jgi:hypothetical protein